MEERLDRPKISKLQMLFQAESKLFAGFSFFAIRQIFRCLQKTAGSRPISRVLSWTTIHLGSASPQTSSNLPGNPRGPRVPKKPGPLFGLAPGGVYRAAECCHPRGALLPHPFTLAGAEALRRSALCCTFRRLTPPRCYLAPRPMEPGLSSAQKYSDCLADSPHQR